jgi:hypothetical protein
MAGRGERGHTSSYVIPREVVRPDRRSSSTPSIRAEPERCCIGNDTVLGQRSAMTACPATGIPLTPDHR